MLNRVVAEGYMGVKREFATDPWPELYDALKKGTILQGKVVGAVENDGQYLFQVDLGGSIRGLLPQAEMGVENPRATNFVGAVVAFKVKHCDRAGKVVYLSRQDAVEELSRETWRSLEREAKDLIALKPEIDAARKELEAARKAGDLEKVRAAQRRLAALDRKGKETGPVRTCSVRWVSETGAYVDVGGVGAFLPRRELAYSFVGDAREIVQPGDAFDVRIYRVDPENKLIDVSLKAVLPDPWEHVAERYVEGGLYAGRIASAVKRGVLVELEPGLTAFVPAPDAPPVGSEVVLAVTQIKPDRQFIRGVIARVRRVAEAV